MSATCFAASFANPAGSPIRELFPYLSRPGIISLAGGYPSPALLDGEGLQQAALDAWADPAACLQYGPTEGAPALRSALAQLSLQRGVRCEAADLLVTTGSQQAFDTLVRILLEPGDCVMLEAPAYPAAIQAVRLAGARIESIAVDADGLRIDLLEDALERGVAPKFLYTVPSFSNPSGTTLSAQRRAQLVRLAVEHGFLIVEDDPYGEIAFTDERLPTLFELGEQAAPGRNPVVYLSSLSKTVAPSLRIGWMVADREVLRRATIAKQTMDLCTSPLMQLVAARYLQSGRYPGAVQRACIEYAARMTALTDTLDRSLDGTLRFTRPKGGMFVWAEWRGPVQPRRLFATAVERGVLFVPGAAFHPDAGDRPAMRLSYAAPSVPEIREAASRLAQAFHDASGT